MPSFEQPIYHTRRQAMDADHHLSEEDLAQMRRLWGEVYDGHVQLRDPFAWKSRLLLEDIEPKSPLEAQRKELQRLQEREQTQAALDRWTVRISNEQAAAIRDVVALWERLRYYTTDPNRSALMDRAVSILETEAGPMGTGEAIFGLLQILEDTK
jgi:hypothetical protein